MKKNKSQKNQTHRCGPVVREPLEHGHDRDGLDDVEEGPGAAVRRWIFLKRKRRLEKRSGKKKRARAFRRKREEAKQRGAAFLLCSPLSSSEADAITQSHIATAWSPAKSGENRSRTADALSASGIEARPTSAASPTNLNATCSDSKRHPADTPSPKERSRGSRKKDGSSCGGDAARTLTCEKVFCFSTSSSMRQQENRCSAFRSAMKKKTHLIAALGSSRGAHCAGGAAVRVSRSDWRRRADARRAGEGFRHGRREQGRGSHLARFLLLLRANVDQKEKKV